MVKGAKAEKASHPDRVPRNTQRIARATFMKHSARAMHRYYEKGMKIPKPYVATATFWNKKKNCKVERPMAFLPMHEIVSAHATPETASEFCEFDDSKSALDASLRKTCAKLGISRDNVASVALWGDHAEYNTRDSLCLLLWSFISGVHRRRWWLCSFSKMPSLARSLGQILSRTPVSMTQDLPPGSILLRRNSNIVPQPEYQAEF